MKNLNIHYFQHVPYEAPGCIEQWAVRHGHTLTATHFYDSSYSLPDIESIDALIIMGGPMGVYDDHLLEWLTIEKEYIATALQKNKKVLGICLGAQLIAACAGAAVNTAPHKETGWFKISPAKQLPKTHWLYEIIEDEPVVFHWHNDRFQLPDGTENLAVSEANDNQLFMLNENVLAIQFHLEITERGLSGMIENGADELIPGAYVQPAYEITALQDFVKDNNRRMYRLLDRFLLS
ncbi:type 1 glutamine amidotransferase [Agriterribacter sp.]|uniref:type 1 glutamine amidotransferase n=1 Tax=Agriterribacter sp. TaxID=2821509 RepID=UPI002C90580C|nr:type 1 glutamine amidotransferase [Agriterribacter sp.]HRP55842.1 type 1 glutamine amidotransferase [Agriterribacter sp.]